MSVLDFIQRPFHHLKSKICFQDTDWANNVHQLFHEEVFGKDKSEHIPSLNHVRAESVRPGGLVKFRCMIQDMLDPEYFLSVYEVKNTITGSSSIRLGYFSDVADCQTNEVIDNDSTKNLPKERQQFYCVPIPGENEWVKSAYASQSKWQEAGGGSTSSPRREKRERECEGESEDGQMAERVEGGDGGASMKKLKGVSSGEGEVKETSARKQHAMNFPLGDSERGPGVLVKVYEVEEGKFKLNDMIEFYGILTIDPTLHASRNGDGEDAEMMDTEIPPPSLVPRMHAVTWRKLQTNNPFVASPSAQRADSYTELQSILCQAMFGDALVADYLLCSLVSRVFGRSEIMALGKFSLNVSGCPPGAVFTRRVYDLLSTFLTQSCYVPLKLSAMNAGKFVPRKDYSTNRLSSGCLQLPPGAFLLLDETAMDEGQLDPQGVKNLTALGQVITSQQLEYDFTYHGQSFPTDVRVLTLSEGVSVLPSDCHVPLVPAVPFAQMEQQYSAISTYMSEDLLRRLRVFLDLCRHSDYEVSDALQKRIQDDFVELRGRDSSVGAEDLHHMLTLARLLSVTRGQSTLTDEIWQRAKEMETARRERIAEYKRIAQRS